MQFMPELQQFLLDNGRIFTVRKFKMDSRLVYIETGEKCRRLFIRQIKTKEELEPYVSESGFDNLRDWWSKIRYFIPPQGPFYLYQVDLLPILPILSIKLPTKTRGAEKEQKNVPNHS